MAVWNAAKEDHDVKYLSRQEVHDYLHNRDAKWGEVHIQRMLAVLDKDEAAWEYVDAKAKLTAAGVLAKHPDLAKLFE